MAQLIARVSLAVGVISYAGQFNIMVVADRDAYPDLDMFVAGVCPLVGSGSVQRPGGGTRSARA